MQSAMFCDRELETMERKTKYKIDRKYSNDACVCVWDANVFEVNRDSLSFLAIIDNDLVTKKIFLFMSVQKEIIYSNLFLRKRNTI